MAVATTLSGFVVVGGELVSSVLSGRVVAVRPPPVEPHAANNTIVATPARTRRNTVVRVPVGLASVGSGNRLMRQCGQEAVMYIGIGTLIVIIILILILT
ncbi:MAG: hypothetical protein M3256_18890 [Actinomycetota bacterium]|nr:hypothetical protein [Actinomycetota bacterium]